MASGYGQGGYYYHDSDRLHAMPDTMLSQHAQFYLLRPSVV